MYKIYKVLFICHLYAMVRRPVSICQHFPLKCYCSRTDQKKVTKFDVLHHRGKGNHFFFINEGAGPQGGHSGRAQYGK